MWDCNMHFMTRPDFTQGIMDHGQNRYRPPLLLASIGISFRPVICLKAVAMASSPFFIIQLRSLLPICLLPSLTPDYNAHYHRKTLTPDHERISYSSIRL